MRWTPAYSETAAGLADGVARRRGGEIFVLFLLLALLPPLAGAVSLELEAAQMELGQPLRGVVLTAQAPTAETLQPLEADFAVVVRGGAERQADGRYRLGFSLYPRREGAVPLPDDITARVSSKQLPPPQGDDCTDAVGRPCREHAAQGRGEGIRSIFVTAAIERGQLLEVRQSVSTLSPWVRQQVLVLLEVITPEPYASLQADPVSLPGFEVIPLPGSSEKVATAAGTQTRLRAGWALFAVAPGRYRPALPPLRYRLSGASRRLFPLTLPALEARALPPYVPPTLPVGRVELSSTLAPDGLLHTGHLAHWRVSVSAPAVPPAWLPPLLRGLAADGAVEFLPAQTTYAAAPDAGGIHARAEHLIPLRPRRDGRLALPVLEVQYFDPDSGRLERVSHAPPRPLVLGSAARWGAAALLLALLVWLAPKAWRFVADGWHRRRARRAALAALARAEDLAAIRAALRRYAEAMGGPASLALDAWYCRHAPAAAAELAELAAASFGGGDADVIALRQRLWRRLR
ncbi:MAG: hypothetical protein AB1450_07665 [Pseudomonadota bacterium]